MVDPTVLNRNKIGVSHRDYVAWLADAVAMKAETGLGGGIELVPVASANQSPSEAIESITIESIDDLGKLWDLERGIAGGAIEAQPEGDPSQVAAIAGSVLQPYRVRHGRVQLAGCSLEPQPFLRLSQVDPLQAQIRHDWFDRDGSTVGSDFLTQMKLDRLIVTPPRLKERDRQTVDDWIDAAIGNADRQRFIGSTVVWCRWVCGKVRVQFDRGQHTYIAFEGWAMQWAKGLIEPPKYRCPVTGIESYNMICLEDGTITVAEAVALCELTGQETFRSALGQCSISGKRVLAEKLTTCPISGSLFLMELAEICDYCQRPVSPEVLDRGCCQQCNDLKSIEPDDPVIVALRERERKYNGIRRWKGWITDDLAVLVGSRWLREVLVVVKPDGMQIQRTGTRNRISKDWQFQD